MLLIATGALTLALALLFFLQTPIATALWPFPASRLSNIFIASILAATAIPVMWLGLSGDFAAARGGAANLALTNTGIAMFAAQLWTREQHSGALIYGVASVALIIFLAVILAWSCRIRFQDTRRTAPLVRVSFAVFAIGLLYFGGNLALSNAQLFPWPLKPEQSTIYGWIFLGSAVYFAYGVLNPVWSNAKGQLLGFLAYDLVLIVPFILHFKTVPPDLWVNLVIYLAVIVYSGGLALYYLFVNRQTRLRVPRVERRTVRSDGEGANPRARV
ncbi:MAG TPA: hypothetical protein VGO08_04080 [Burkholderiales bacterium]|nr:hypothetical protein [Burkholderiales bacterium]